MTSTKERILDASLELFNHRGERNVTTNHIAEALGISPGNLYYHFRNKSMIVAALFERYQHNLLTLLEQPQGPLSWKVKVYYFEGLLASMWQYRFFHRDLSHLLNADEELAAAYRLFVERVVESGLVIYGELRNSGILEMTDDQLEGLMVNTWVLMSSWAALVHALRPDATADESLDESLMRHGIYQIICLEEPFLRGEARDHLEQMKARYRSPDSSPTLLLVQQGAASKEKAG
ncbi:TetR family transcriptional regulator [Alcanivorax hongdengensis A-11-3]|uniref:TetR family transcriptional regulator n=1 Tax=Alcanivorax hongdengensis A-11-3 TaxID=1177179 RepID=L0W8E2_9GAMM|nr:TetR/AcrR family transcriptional regulator [Alcanivorax hongdengensis]EKF73191.1 TetR family transcriptional regulator [Alcanivorax hongdengensis A-11-3]